MRNKNRSFEKAGVVEKVILETTKSGNMENKAQQYFPSIITLHVKIKHISHMVNVTGRSIRFN